MDLTTELTVGPDYQDMGLIFYSFRFDTFNRFNFEQQTVTFTDVNGLSNIEPDSSQVFASANQDKWAVSMNQVKGLLLDVEQSQDWELSAEDSWYETKDGIGKIVTLSRRRLLS